jgi:thiamine-phosphate pyrophosphorylase
MGSEHAVLRGLYAITPEMSDTARLVAQARLALAGGARLLLYRAKGLERALALEQATRLRVECTAHGAIFIVNDSLELARAADADGVHLGRDDLGAAQARAAWPKGLIGVSCYADPARARQAAAEGADYVAIGSVFASPTKRSASRAPLAAIAQAKALARTPVAAIGGITPANARAAVDAGADMLAVISSLFDAPDVRAAARSLARWYDATEAAHDARAKPRAV